MEFSNKKAKKALVKSAVRSSVSSKGIMNWKHQNKVGVADLLTRPGLKRQILATSSGGPSLAERPDEAGSRRLRDLSRFGAADKTKKKSAL